MKYIFLYFILVSKAFATELDCESKTKPFLQGLFSNDAKTRIQSANSIAKLGPCALKSLSDQGRLCQDACTEDIPNFDKAAYHISSLLTQKAKAHLTNNQSPHYLEALLLFASFDADVQPVKDAKKEIEGILETLKTKKLEELKKIGRVLETKTADGSIAALTLIKTQSMFGPCLFTYHLFDKFLKTTASFGNQVGSCNFDPNQLFETTLEGSPLALVYRTGDANGICLRKRNDLKAICGFIVPGPESLDNKTTQAFIQNIQLTKEGCTLNMKGATRKSRIETSDLCSFK